MNGLLPVACTMVVITFSNLLLLVMFCHVCVQCRQVIMNIDCDPLVSFLYSFFRH